MNYKQIQQATQILKQAGISLKHRGKETDETEDLLEFTITNIKKATQANDPQAYLAEKISFLEELYGGTVNPNKKKKTTDPLTKSDCYKTKILKVIQNNFKNDS